MKARDMKPDRLYKLKNHQVVNLHFFSYDGKWAIVSEPGDLDMQSKFGIDLDEEVTEIVEDDRLSLEKLFNEIGDNKTKLAYVLSYLDCKDKMEDFKEWLAIYMKISRIETSVEYWDKTLLKENKK